MFVSAGCLSCVLMFQADLPQETSSFDVTEAIVYSKAGDRELLLDAYVPSDENEHPGVLVVHGGAWRSGNRKQLKGYCEALASRGFTCFAIDYRLAPAHKFPAQIDDCRAAVKWIRQNAEKYKATSDVLGAIGYSAGGHLVSLLGTTGEAPDESNGNIDTRLTAVAAGGAPTDFRWFPDNGKWAEFWMGGDLDSVPEKFKAASTVPFVDKNDPPFFFFNGTSDKVVPIVWTKSLFEALKAAGVQAELHEVAGASHMQAAADKQALTKAYEFLAANLKQPVSPKKPDQKTGDEASGNSSPDDGEVQIKKDVSYLPAGRSEKLDLYLPSGVSDQELRPGILIIHGGGWVKGDKGAKREINIGTTLAKNGYVCASINYKLGKPKSDTFAHKLNSGWPQNIHDCKTALRWMRKNSKQYGIDPNRIGVIGGSAGGHLTAMLGVTSSKDGLDPVGPYSEFSTNVDAFVPLYAPSDLVFRSKARKEWDSLPAELKDLCRTASPATYADMNDPPALIMHGTKDTTVDIEQSRRLSAAFTKAGLKHDLEIVEGAPHTFHLQPKQKDLRPLVLGFFDTHVKHKQIQKKEAGHE